MCSRSEAPCGATAKDTGSSESKTKADRPEEHSGRRDEHPALKHWAFREIFAGAGHLTKAFRQRHAVKVLPAFEVYQKGKYQASGDILNDESFNQLCEDASKPRQYWHFGFPCGSFSLMQNMNKGTRTKSNPWGLGLCGGRS